MTIPQNDKRRCYNCKFYYRHNRGYSNYTVEETEVNCLRNKNKFLHYTPEGYAWEADDHAYMRVAESCDGYVFGEPLTVDCDEEQMPPGGKKSLVEYYSNDKDVVDAFKAWGK